MIDCPEEAETVVQVNEYGLRFDMCESHAEARVEAFDEMHRVEE